MEKGDQAALQYLGAALVLQWHKVSPEIQKVILQQAMAIGGLPPLATLQAQVRGLIRRNQEDA